MNRCVKLLFAILTTLFPFTFLQAQHLVFLDHRPDTAVLQTYIQSYNIGSAQDLYVRLNTGKSLVEELQALAPEFPKDELIKHGNYQFRFLIDGKVIYKEDLGPGAILQKDKLINKPLDVVLASRTRSGLWSINLWDRFLSGGGAAVSGKNTSNLTLELRVYLDNGGLVYSGLLAKGILKVTTIPQAIDQTKIAPQVIQPGSGWELSKAKYNKALITEMNTKIEDQTYRLINGIVVIKDSQLLLEEYFNGEKRESLHDPRSVTKSITGTLIGMAIQDGFLKADQQQLKDFYPLKDFQNYSTTKDSVKLADLLTMSSAFDGNDDANVSPGSEDNMQETSDYIKFALNLPMDPKKTNGKQWSYFTAGMIILGDILEKSIPGGVESYAKRKLFDPLGIDQYEWFRAPKDQPYMGGGLKLRALDFAKYGQLYKNGGLWKGQRLIAEQWISKSFDHLQTLPPDRPGFYGYLFWNKAFNVNGKAYEVYYASGNGGNKIYIFKDQPLVIVVNASAYGRGFAHAQVDQLMEQYIIPAVR
ncbi:CubicO group peptidase (beta-lactamase class C family) [Pedobacter cryoconitis]|uniref:CubicO group peptidase (Beta-lactamase class C family) n=1 Tax=Pedobacter cryoconitis TaxID=188932 RepID=A0A7W8YXZ3_9SPHI|nr:serine hydrolase [Pedobacter cryoconitis]MBB5623866.1 CubicO group peptidase (beta-lactamase class C family) [Pedobacter cryoconitis]